MEEKNEKKLELERKTKMRSNLIREQELFAEQMPELRERLRIHKAGIDILRSNQKIILDNFKLQKVTWDYETVPEYVENLKKLNILNFERAELDWQKQTDQYVNGIKSAEDQLASSKKLLEETEKSIKALEEELNGSQ